MTQRSENDDEGRVGCGLYYPFMSMTHKLYIFFNLSGPRPFPESYKLVVLLRACSFLLSIFVQNYPQIPHSPACFIQQTYFNLKVWEIYFENNARKILIKFLHLCIAGKLWNTCINNEDRFDDGNSLVFNISLLNY